MTTISKVNSPILDVLQYGNIRERIRAMENPIVFLNSEDFEALKSEAELKDKYIHHLRFEGVRIEGMLEVKKGLFYVMDCKGCDIESLRVCIKVYLIKNKE